MDIAFERRLVKLSIDELEGLKTGMEELVKEAPWHEGLKEYTRQHVELVDVELEFRARADAMRRKREADGRSD